MKEMTGKNARKTVHPIRQYYLPVLFDRLYNAIQGHTGASKRPG